MPEAGIAYLDGIEPASFPEAAREDLRVLAARSLYDAIQAVDAHGRATEAAKEAVDAAADAASYAAARIMLDDLTGGMAEKRRVYQMADSYYKSLST